MVNYRIIACKSQWIGCKQNSVPIDPNKVSRVAKKVSRVARLVSRVAVSVRVACEYSLLSLVYNRVGFGSFKFVV